MPTRRGSTHTAVTERRAALWHWRCFVRDTTHAGGSRLHDEPDVADSQLIAGTELRLGVDTPAVEERAVGRTAILDQPATLDPPEQRVPP